MVPAWRQVIDYRSGDLESSGKKTVAVTGRPQVSVNFFGRRFNLYENTHLELLLAREMMVKLGLKSVAVVSPLYHMRRLQLIIGKVFADGGYDIGLQPTDFEKYDCMGCFRSGCCRKYVA